MTTEVAPVVDEHERERRFPTEIVRRIGELGWLGIPIPEDEGGAGLDTLAYAIAIEEIGRVWGSLGLIVAAHTSLGCGPLHLAGSPEQKQRLLVPMARGEVIGAYGLTEPGAGCDSGGTRTTARHEDGPDGGAWVLDGAKRFITNAGQAGTYIVTARTGAGRPRATPEISAFIVPADTPGFSVGRLEEKLGLHASATGELRFEGARVPAANLLGEQGERLQDVPQDPRRRPDLDRRAGRRARPGRARRLDPVCPDARAVRPSDRHVPGRRVHGRRHGDRDRGCAPARLALRVAQGPGPRLRACGRAGEALRVRGVSSRATNDGIQIHGGYGYVTDYPVERFMRDAKLTEIGEGTSQVQRLVIARKILGLRVVYPRRACGRGALGRRRAPVDARS